jgi:hypothetical protein
VYVIREKRIEATNRQVWGAILSREDNDSIYQVRVFVLHSPPLHATCCEDFRASLAGQRKGLEGRLAKVVPNIKNPESERECLNL